jgi:hypothetical protein
MVSDKMGQNRSGKAEENDEIPVERMDISWGWSVNAYFWSILCRSSQTAGAERASENRSLQVTT